MARQQWLKDDPAMVIGFIVNPIAGMGGRVGLKGTDHAAEQALALGARPSSPTKAVDSLRAAKALMTANDHQPTWLTAAGTMGADSLQEAGFYDFEVIHPDHQHPTADDTKAICKKFIERKADLILFCGGDGTARDICSVVGQQIPMLGIPAGVKMYSGVFGISPARTAEILNRFLARELAIGSADILDLDEEKYRQGQWIVRLCDIASVPVEPTFVQAAKSLIEGSSESEHKQEIADTIYQDAISSPDTLYIFGPGSTMAAIGDRFGISKTLLGIDAFRNDKQVGTDLNESGLLALLDMAASAKLILSPIGAQGFVLGRGNLQISPDVVKRVGLENLIVVATPGKLSRTPCLRFDTGESSLDRKLNQMMYLPVVIGYRKRRMVRIQI